jgi:putative SOS response-associated peptidase YedK
VTFPSRLLKRRRCIAPIDGWVNGGGWATRLRPVSKSRAGVIRFFEWKKHGDGKDKKKSVPHFVHAATKGTPLFIAGLWDRWLALGGRESANAIRRFTAPVRWVDTSKTDAQPLYTFTLLTTDSDKQLSWWVLSHARSWPAPVFVPTALRDRLHDRMPVILDAEGAAKWLDVESMTFQDCAPLLKPTKARPCTVL